MRAEEETHRENPYPLGARSQGMAALGEDAHMLTPVCDTQCCPQTLPMRGCRIFMPSLATPNLLVFNIGDAIRKSQGKSITAREVILV